MATYANVPDLHLRAGARWLAWFSAIVVAAFIALMAMVVYPYVTS
jgi:hypothetical protein